ncbi:MAG: UDP-N-acetylmuramoyl-L-alanyl-D-glutamate--2,6-diaminopimelate ligase [Pseudomonadota bacterium]
MEPHIKLDTCTGLAFDHRQVRPGYLFAALKGKQHDGRAYIDQAIKKGATAILVAPPPIRLSKKNTAIQVFYDNNPRRRLAELARDFYGRQPRVMAAVTGTNGKSSVVTYLTHIWRHAGYQAQALGTLSGGMLTTADPITLHRQLAKAAEDGIDHMAIEASSHGLDQHRIDGVRVSIAAFTNLGRDHLDYHKTRRAYGQAKARLFYEVLQADGHAVINADDATGRAWIKELQKAGRRVWSYGRKGKAVRLHQIKALEKGFFLTLEVHGHDYQVSVPVITRFQVSNALCALTMALSEVPPETAVAALADLPALPGRMQEVSPGVFVDYAHTPDAVGKVLSELRPRTRGQLMIVVGCGGDRDPGKRPQFAKMCARYADRAIITDDNPRWEDPAAIRAQILRGVPSDTSCAFIDIAPRDQAIAAAITSQDPDDVVLISGRGHEPAQLIKGREIKLDDAVVARRMVRQKKTGLWSMDDLRKALAAHTPKMTADTIPARGVSIDSRTLRAQDLFIALTGPTFDGHDFIEPALARGAAAVMIRAGVKTRSSRVLGVDDPAQGLRSLAVYARARMTGTVIGVTGSVGKTTVKDLLGFVLRDQSRAVHTTTGNLNNHWGVPLTLARMPTKTDFAVIEIGMSAAGEITDLTTMAKPNLAIITSVSPAHMENFSSLTEVAAAKAEIFHSKPQAAIIADHDATVTPILMNAARKAGVRRIVTYPSEEAYFLSSRISSRVSSAVSIHGQTFEFSLPSASTAMRQNALGVLLTVAELGGDIARAIKRLSKAPVPDSRGVSHKISWKEGRITVIDDSYNASPASMVAGLQDLANAAGRRIAVLGDMLELGEGAQDYHHELLPYLEKIDKLFACGALMKSLFTQVTPARQGVWVKTAEALRPHLMKGLKPGDTVFIKGSNSMKMRILVAALKQEDRDA